MRIHGGVFFLEIHMTNKQYFETLTALAMARGLLQRYAGIHRQNDRIEAAQEAEHVAGKLATHLEWFINQEPDRLPQQQQPDIT